MKDMWLRLPCGVENGQVVIAWRCKLERLLPPSASGTIRIHVLGRRLGGQWPTRRRDDGKEPAVLFQTKPLHFPDKFRELYEEYGITEEVVAQRADTTKDVIYRSRTGVYDRPTPEMCFRLGYALGAGYGFYTMIDIVDKLLIAAGHQPFGLKRRVHKKVSI